MIRGWNKGMVIQWQGDRRQGMLLQRGEMLKGLIPVANSEQTAKELIPSVWSSHRTARANQAEAIADPDESGGNLSHET
jgi:hypothetical protein